MDLLLFCLSTYGLMFGIANKLPILHGKFKVIDSLLGCSFCLGYHCGWINHLIFNLGIDSYNLLFIHAFCGAAFCYFFDTAIEVLEKLKE